MADTHLFFPKPWNTLLVLSGIARLKQSDVAAVWHSEYMQPRGVALAPDAEELEVSRFLVKRGGVAERATSTEQFQFL